MKLLSFRVNGMASFGALVNGRVVDLKKRLNGKYADLCTALAADALPELEQAIQGAQTHYSLEEIEFLPVIPNPPKIICIGINYRSHADETSGAPPAKPMVFGRFANSQIGHGQPIRVPPESVQLDYEGEIAVVIGKRGRRISLADAWSYVAGYAPYNDGSIRDWQWHSTQWTMGKNFYRTGGFGPWMATRGEIADNAELHLITRLNGTEMQRATSHQMIFSIPQLIEYCSKATELEPGDVIVTGTPGGVGLKRNPPVFMKHGDVIEVEISEIGTLRNPIKNESAD
jgi:2-keto-4-pentenoate hydratase/2-oxohepta-3-ene-1,7-dioic acid hydratase in catechol pathway